MSFILTTGGKVEVEQTVEEISGKYFDGLKVILFTRMRVEERFDYPGDPLYLVRSAIVGWHR